MTLKWYPFKGNTNELRVILGLSGSLEVFYFKNTSLIDLNASFIRYPTYK